MAVQCNGGKIKFQVRWMAKMCQMCEVEKLCFLKDGKTCLENKSGKTVPTKWRQNYSFIISYPDTVLALGTLTPLTQLCHLVPLMHVCHKVPLKLF